MFRKALLSASLITASFSALAADLPARVAPAPYVAVPIFTWTGFYAGLNAGAAFNASNNPTVFTNPALTVYTGIPADSSTPFTGGAQVGYNWQFGSFVAGVEADINYLSRARGSNGVFPTPVDLSPGYDNRVDFAVRNSGNSDWFGTVRGRLGYAFDRVLVFATGGIAFTGKQGYAVDQREIFETTTPPLFGPSGVFVTNPVRQLPGSSGSSTVGWALGAGFEYAFTNSMSVKLEYMHVDFGSDSQTFTTLASGANVTVGQPAGGIYGGGNTITVRHDNSFDLVRAGMNFRF